MAQTNIRVRELVDKVQRGEIALPEMQRRYVWPATRVRNLLDSLYRGYPSGTILVWETDQKEPTRDLSVSQNENPFSGHKLLLDGQQRLTSLSAILRGEPINTRGRKREIDILFNIDHPDTLSEFTEVTSDEDSPILEEEAADEIEEEEEVSVQERMRNMTFVVSAKSLAQQPNWISVTNVFKSENDSLILKAAGVMSFDDPRYEKYSARLKKLKSMRDYLYVMHVLPKDLSYEEVAEIFVRVNSLGAKLRGSDLALAQITAKWRNSLELLEQFQDECEDQWMTLDLGLLVRAMVVFSTGQARFDSVGTIPVAKLKQGWEEAKEGMRFAINFLRTNANIEDESLLSSPLFFVTIAYFYHARKGKLNKDEEQTLLYWFYIANARGRYSRGSTETLLDADLAVIKKGKGADVLTETVRQQFGRLNIESSDFIGRGAGSSLFSLVFLTLKAKGAKDWKTGLELSLTHQGKYHYIQYHHIFPKAKLKGLYERQEINEISNMAFISGQKNREIGATEPAKYLPDIILKRGKEALSSQAMPLDNSLYEISAYRKFLETRREMLATEVNAFLNAVRT